MDDMLNNVSSQIQRAINEAINSQVLPQIQNAMMAGSVHETRRGWEVPAEIPETDAEEQRNSNVRTNCRNERHDVRQKGGISNHSVHDNCGKSYSAEYNLERGPLGLKMSFLILKH